MKRTACLAVAAAALAASALWRPGVLTDLEVCVSCARVLAQGGDPYARNVIVKGVDYPCLYPPLAFDAYRPVAALLQWNSQVGMRSWNFGQVLVFLVMLWIWKRHILGPGPDAARLMMALFSFGAPLGVALHAGNGAAFEQVLIWTAFALYAGGYDLAFAAAIAFAAQLKLQPAAFLILLLLRPKPGWRSFLFGAALFCLLFGLNELLHPGLLKSFFLRLSEPTEGWRYERGPNNCSVLGFLQHVLETAGLERMVAASWAKRAFLPWAAVIAVGTGLALGRVWTVARTQEVKRRASVLLVCAAFALLAPRFKDYAYYLLIPSALAALESDAPLGLRAAIVVLAVLNSTKSVALWLGAGPWAMFAGYFKLYAAVLVWFVLTRARTLPSAEHKDLELSSTKG
ncbi:MAG: glycosyltransferase 87 family protein [Elusimicrobiota bacterium]